MSTVLSQSSADLLESTMLRRLWQIVQLSWTSFLAPPSGSGYPPGWLASGSVKRCALAGGATQTDAARLKIRSDCFMPSPSSRHLRGGVRARDAPPATHPGATATRLAQAGLHCHQR